MSGDVERIYNKECVYKGVGIVFRQPVWDASENRPCWFIRGTRWDGPEIANVWRRGKEKILVSFRKCGDRPYPSTGKERRGKRRLSCWSCATWIYFRGETGVYIIILIKCKKCTAYSNISLEIRHLKTSRGDQYRDPGHAQSVIELDGPPRFYKFELKCLCLLLNFTIVIEPAEPGLQRSIFFGMIFF